MMRKHQRFITLALFFLISAAALFTLYGPAVYRNSIQNFHASTPREKVSHIDSDPTDAHNPSNDTSLKPNEVVLLMRTGASLLWRRLPMHMATTLRDRSRIPNYVLYSDVEETIAGEPVIDVLANISQSLRDSEDLETYRRQTAGVPKPGIYLEWGNMLGDNGLDITGGWTMDRYKFIPMFAHAQRNWPDVKWYVSMEADTYLFWENLVKWLATLDSDETFYIGGPAYRLGEDFAHGGSGIVLSNAAMKKTFGAHPDLALKSEVFGENRCCGDHILAHTLHQFGIERYRATDEWGAFQEFPHWRMGFRGGNLCLPIFSMHKVHQKDISRLYEFERKHTRKKGYIVHLDVYNEFIAPELTKDELPDWDNFANEKLYRSETQVTEAEADVFKRIRPWFSKEACKEMCVEWKQCLMWNYADDYCQLASYVTIGMGSKNAIRKTSGWLRERISAVVKTVECSKKKLVL